MRSCREVTRLLSESFERRLTLPERLGLWMHLHMCKLCHGFSEDLQRLHELAQQHSRWWEQEAERGDVQLSSDARKRIEQAISNAQS